MGSTENVSRGSTAVLSRRRFDVDEYHRMMHTGILVEGDRIELLQGEIVEMTPIGSRHVSCVGRLTRIFVLALSDRAFVTAQGVVRLDRYSEPQPDLLVLRWRDDDYAGHTANPADTLLLVEVADSSLRTDRDLKLSLYAAAAIPEVWIVDLESEAVEVYREPEGDRYRRSERISEGTVQPHAFPELAIAIADILPPRS